MKKLGAVHLIIEKRDSKLVPFDIVHSEVRDCVDETAPGNFMDDVSLLETEHVGLPAFDFPFEVGDRLEFTADFYGEFFSYWTDCGTEHDANFEFRDVKDLMVWKCAYEAPCTPVAEGRKE